MKVYGALGVLDVGKTLRQDLMETSLASHASRPNVFMEHSIAYYVSYLFQQL